MTAFALGLLLAAGFVHAGWNYLAKQAGGGTVFVWLFASISALFYAPLAVFVAAWFKPNIGLPETGILLATIVVHLIYFLLRNRHGHPLALRGRRPPPHPRRRRDRLRIGGIGGWMIPAPACTAIQPTLPVMGNA